ncbi:MAG TPA: cupredoxin family copper-binding protein [Chthoniobacterales bacterium]|nr:cupredoxin family copper-binding protein [Chthoniobacterales bacterium]
MYTLIRNQTPLIIVAIGSLILTNFGHSQVDKGAPADGPKKNQIVIKDFHFTPQTLTVKSGETITWINRDEEPHLVVSVEKQFKKSPALDTDQEFTVTAGAPGTYTYFCSIHPKMTGTIVVEKS